MKGNSTIQDDTKTLNLLQTLTQQSRLSSNREFSSEMSYHQLTYLLRYMHAPGMLNKEVFLLTLDTQFKTGLSHSYTTSSSSYHGWFTMWLQDKLHEGRFLVFHTFISLTISEGLTNIQHSYSLIKCLILITICTFSPTLCKSRKVKVKDRKGNGK